MNLKYPIPNFITALRIVGTGFLLFIKPFSTSFYVVYALCGVSDVLDGAIARATGNTSAAGAMLDSVADLLFYGVMVIRILPMLWQRLPMGIWYAVGAVLLLRFASYSTAALRFHRFAALHTYMNKLTGAAVFALPCFILLPVCVPYCVGACVLAGIASAEELLIHALSSEYDANRKSIIRKDMGHGF
ncbi:MAG: CDP-alcohol phosphatidyltransferase family protein [Faecousia sp.]